MQGDIISKVWLYKDKMGHVQGPFMSYDMDIWNGEGNYFADDLKVALMNNTYLPIQMYQDRHQLVIDIVQNFLAKAEHLNKADPKRSFEANRKHGNNNNNSHNKKYSFQKKNDKEREDFHGNQAPINHRTSSELSSNFQEHFPSLAESYDKSKQAQQNYNNNNQNNNHNSNNNINNNSQNPNHFHSHSQPKTGEPTLLDTLRGLQPPKRSDTLPVDQQPKADPRSSRKDDYPRDTGVKVENEPQQPTPAKQSTDERSEQVEAEIKLVKTTMPRRESHQNLPSASSNNNSNYANNNNNSKKKGKRAVPNNENGPAYEPTPANRYTEKPGNPKGEGNQELTDNIKNLLGLGFK